MIADSRYPHLVATMIFVTLVLLCIGLLVDQRLAHAQSGIIRDNAVNNADAGNDGSTWDNAFLSLQDAISAANANNQITQVWVAKGVYLSRRGRRQDQ